MREVCVSSMFSALVLCVWTWMRELGFRQVFSHVSRFQRTTMRYNEESPMSVESSSKEVSTAIGGDGGGSVPSGFILKLFQMVNGAPDEVISWTPAGDAFIIGSDLNRLESETLPQYFRHNRFQSLVRQLNFYSFRKINRERHVWIYKHKLFHRDRPEDLYMVRRRTCPGVDGRKQRFSRFSAQKLSKFDDDEEEEEEDKAPPSSDDETSSETTSGDEREEVFEVPKKKREIDEYLGESVDPKRAKRVWTPPSKPSPTEEPTVVVDTSIISSPTPSPTSVFQTHESLVDHEEEEDDDSSANRKNDRLEMIEQSMIISEVASKLEEHARKALGGRGTSRTRRGVVGVVTPPWASSSNFTVSTRGLITYDDEYEDEEEPAIIDDGDESPNDDSNNSIVNSKSEAAEDLSPPVADVETVKRIGNEIRRRASYNFYNSEMIQACANVAEFFMSTAPGETADNLSEKILLLLSASGRLAADFYTYRAALHPGSPGESSALRYRIDQQQVLALRRTLQGGAGRNDAIREFKTFCVNLIYKLLGKNGSFDIKEPLAAPDRASLSRTAEIWSQSVGTGV